MAIFDADFKDDLAGALLAGVIDGGLDVVQKIFPALVGKFPFTPTIDPLPQADKVILLSASAAPYLYGKYKRAPTTLKLGKGMLSYSLPMVVNKIALKQMGGT
jgi:hypothetical protein